MNKLQFLVYFIHITIFIGIIIPDTKFYTYYYSKKYFPIIFYTIITFTTMTFYQLACGGPGFIDSEDNQPLECENLFFCQKCQKYIPVRASHCKECDKCVLRRDHHCPFLGICIGMNNHFYFLVYLFFENIFCIMSIQNYIPGMKDGLPFVKWLYTSLPSTTFLCLSMVIIIQPILLFPFHVYLMFSNRTTWELMKKPTISYLRKWFYSMSPFSHGLINNAKEFITMRWTHPIYSIPASDEDFAQWRADNSCVSNDKYECC